MLCVCECSPVRSVYSYLPFPKSAAGWQVLLSLLTEKGSGEEEALKYSLKSLALKSPCREVWNLGF